MTERTRRACRRCGALEPDEGFPRPKRLRCRACHNAEQTEWLHRRKERLGRRDGEDVPCPDCARWFRTYTALTSHRSAVHGYRAPAVGQSGDFACPYCKRRYANRRGLGSHVRHAHGNPADWVPAKHDPIVRRAYRLRSEYDITLAEEERIRSRQGGRCAGCGRGERPLHVDHVHDHRRQVRGLLCTQCNTAIGHAHDDPVVLVRMARYVDSPALLLPPDGPSACPDCDFVSDSLRGMGVHRRRRHGVHSAALRGDWRQNNLRAKFRLSVQQYAVLHAAQDGRCVGCLRTATEAHIDGRPLFVDHDHTTSRVRGLLCGNCNFIIGKTDDDPTVLLSLATYLRRFMYGQEEGVAC